MRKPGPDGKDLPISRPQKLYADAQASGESKSDWARVRSEQASGAEPAMDADSPDATQLMREAVATLRAGLSPGSGNTEKVAGGIGRWEIE